MLVHALRSGAIGGLIAGVLMEAFLIATVTASDHRPFGETAIALFQFTAAGAIGKAAAYSSSAFAWLGAAVHFVISVAWATGFAYLAQTRRQLLSHPLVSGLAFGFMVWLLMQIVLIGAGLFANPTPQGLAIALIAHCVFFGLPIAYVTARTMPAAA